MKLNILQTVIAVCLCWLASSLHLQTQSQLYDQDKYLDSLRKIQLEFEAKLKSIQQTFQKFDATIDSASKDPQQQLRLLQEGIADERDSLYAVQQFLALPWTQRLCQCFNFTTQLKAQLQTQLDASYQAILDLENQTQSQCRDCKMSLAILNQTKYERAYLKTMNDTLHSKCCTKAKIIYKDNLNSSNWMYASTQSEYEENQEIKIKNATSNDTIVRFCPLYTPYASSDLFSCLACRDQTFIFNLKTRRCEECPTAMIFNFEKHQCEFDVVCPAGSYFNQGTVSCERISPQYNQSICPLENPVWNPQAKGCFKCDTSNPYFDKILGKCTGCPQDFIYDSSINACKHKNCLSNQYYNEINKMCENKPSITSDSSSSYCPVDKPFWDQSSLSCTRCQIITPFYNDTSKNCETCPNGTNYDSSRSVCTKECGQGQQLNLVTLVCENITIIIQNPTDRTSLCPPDRPIWNNLTKYCSQCPSDAPFWIDRNSTCSRCPDGQIWNNTLSACSSTSQIPICEAGYTFNPAIGVCVQSGVVVSCPPEKPKYNALLLACEACPQATPYFNNISKQCSSSISQTITIPTCPPSTPIYDERLKICTSCPTGQTWNPTSKLCTTIIPTDCPFLQEWNNTYNRCIPCFSYQKYNNVTKKCINFCKEEEVYSIAEDSCKSTASRCPIGLLFDATQLLCVCAQGKNYRFVEELNKCQVFCNTNEIYDAMLSKCVPA